MNALCHQSTVLSVMPFLSAHSKGLHIQGHFLKGQLYNPFSNFCCSFLIFIWQYLPAFAQLSQVFFCGTKCNGMPQYSHLLNTVPFQGFRSFLGLIRYCSFLNFFSPLYIIAQYHYSPSTLACNFYFDFHFVIFCQYFTSPSPQQRLYFSLLTAVCIQSKFSCKFNLFAAWPCHF